MRMLFQNDYGDKSIRGEMSLELDFPGRKDKSK